MCLCPPERPPVDFLGGPWIPSSESLLYSSKWEKKDAVSYLCYYNYVTPRSLTPDQGFPSSYCRICRLCHLNIGSYVLCWGRLRCSSFSRKFDRHGPSPHAACNLWEELLSLPDLGYPGDICQQAVCPLALTDSVSGRNKGDRAEEGTCRWRWCQGALGMMTSSQGRGCGLLSPAWCFRWTSEPS